MNVATLHRRTLDGSAILQGDTTADIKRGSLVQLRKVDAETYVLIEVAPPRKARYDDQIALSFVLAPWLDDERKEQEQ